MYNHLVPSRLLLAFRPKAGRGIDQDGDVTVDSHFGTMSDST